MISLCSAPCVIRSCSSSHVVNVRVCVLSILFTRKLPDCCVGSEFLVDSGDLGHFMIHLTNVLLNVFHLTFIPVLEYVGLTFFQVWEKLTIIK